MNIRDLQYLVAVAQHLHFGKAANVCCVSQPTLSMQIKKLEDQLGVQLIERNNKNIMMTEIGQAIVLHAQQILNNVKAIKETAHSAINPYAGTIKIGLIPTLGPYLLQHIVTPLNKSFPQLKLHLIEAKTSEIVAQMISGDLDAAILALPISESKLVTKVLFEESFLVAISAQHSLASRKRLNTTDLHDCELLLLEEGHCLREQALDVCNHFKAQQPLHAFHATSLETLRYMIASGEGITLMPSLACVPSSSIKYIPIFNPKPSRKIGMMWRKSSPRERLFEEMSQLITFTMKPIL